MPTYYPQKRSEVRIKLERQNVALLFVLLALPFLNNGLQANEDNVTGPRIISSRAGATEAATASFVISQSTDGVVVSRPGKNERNTFLEIGEAINWTLGQFPKSPKTSGKIFIRAGIYDLRTQIVVNKNGVVLEGEGGNSSILQTGISDNLITLLAPVSTNRLANIEINHLGFRRDHRADGGASLIGTSERNRDRESVAVISGLRITDCRFSFAPSGQAAIQVANPEGVFIIRNHFKKTSSDGHMIHLYTDGYNAGHVYIANNEFIVGNDRTNVTAILLENREKQIKRISILHNHFFVIGPNKGTTNIRSIHLLTRAESTTTEPMQYVQIAGNHFEMGKEAIRIEGGASKIRDVVIESNNFHHQSSSIEEGHRFIYLNSRTRAIRIDKNAFRGPTGGNSSTGIVDETPPQTLESNNITNNSFFRVAIPVVEAPTTRVSSNLGYKTENKGSAVIQPPSNSVSVEHGIQGKLSASEIYVTPTSSLGNANSFWLQDVTPTHFTIRTDAAPSIPVTFAWSARRI